MPWIPTRRLRTVVASLALAAAASLTAWAARDDAVPSPTPAASTSRPSTSSAWPPPEPAGTREGVVLAARSVADHLQLQQDQGGEITPSFVSLRLDALSRLAAAEADAARDRNDPAALRAAAAARVERLRDVRATLARRLSLCHDGADLPLLLQLIDRDLAAAKLNAGKASSARTSATRPQG